jgi:hypothetical protein
MQPRSISKALLRMAFAALLVAVMAPMASHEVEAGRVGKRSSGGVGALLAGKAAAAVARDRVGSSSGAVEESESGPADHAGGEEAAASAQAAPARASVAQALKAASSVRKDVEVPGCAPGNLCTVCIAGCSGDINAIVHSVPKVQRDE